MNQLSIMIKPASSLCNMRCRYCFYQDEASRREVSSFGIMEEETRRVMLDHIFRDLKSGDRVSLCFQGGEPTLAGLDFYRSFVKEAEERKGDVLVSYSIQTNGLCLDDAWCSFLKEHHFLVGLSLDGYAEIHNRARIDAEGKGTFQKIMAAKNRLESMKVEYNVLMVLTRDMASHPARVFSFIQKQDLRYVQFIPCLGELDGTHSPYALDPASFAAFYNTLFPLWKQELMKGNYYSIKLFDDLINLLTDGSENACGIRGECSPQLVVEADGSVYPCDFYVLDEWKAGSFMDSSALEVLASPVMKEFQKRNHRRMPLCEKCSLIRICGGGCKRMQNEVCQDEKAEKCGYQEFLRSCGNDLVYLARRERMARGLR